jgi:CRP/FNR family cyclic AMP-dependent transcriptional regulator
MRFLANRLRRADNDRAHAMSTDVPARLAKVLLRSARQFGVRQGGAVRVTLDLTQEELGQLVGSTRTTINKVLVTFQDRGWIRAEGQNLVIIDSAALARRAR